MATFLILFTKKNYYNIIKVIKIGMGGHKMERKIDAYLMKWKNDTLRKPLFIYGNKQVGKTYTAIRFGERQYKNTVYFNAENNIELLQLFKKEKVIDRIISKLQVYSNETILEEDTLLIFDNIEDLDIVNGLKVFGKFPNKYHIILIASLKGDLNRFKGEEFHYKAMYSMDFEEYLIAIGKKELAEFIRSAYKKSKPMPFHPLALELYDDYIMTGGMPEAVALVVKNDNMLLINSVFDKVMDGFKKEINQLDNLIDISRSVEVLDSIPYQLLKQNRKFQYGLIKAGSRAKDYEKSINFLYNNGFVYRCHKALDIKSPLSSYRDMESFKLYFNDTGLLFSRMHLNKNMYANNYQYKYIIYENSVAITLMNSGYSLYYYQSDGKAEINFIIQTRSGKILPVEIVDQTVKKAKALSLFMTKYNIDEAIRITEDNFKCKNGIKYIPIYATFCLGENL